MTKPPTRHSAPRIRRSSTTTVIIHDGGKKYERPVDLRARTLAGHRCQYAFRKGAGVKT